MSSLQRLVRRTSRQRLLIAVVVIVVAVVALALIANRGPRALSSEEQAVKAFVERFGSRLEQVGLQDPAAKQEIRSVFADLVTPELLDSWLGDPSLVPARHTSSPWPDRIEVRHIVKNADGVYTVTGDVIWVTSLELVEGGTAQRDEVELTVVRRPDTRWRISMLEYIAQPANR